jgi:hypothetical protein
MWVRERRELCVCGLNLCCVKLCEMLCCVKLGEMLTYFVCEMPPSTRETQEKLVRRKRLDRHRCVYVTDVCVHTIFVPSLAVLGSVVGPTIVGSGRHVSACRFWL